jgi:hypothetical protein
MLQKKRLLYSLLFRASAETLTEVAATPRHLGAEIGFLGVLHTWGQTLEHHPHVHYVVPEGGFSPDRSAWVRPKHRFFLPVKVLGKVFRGKLVSALRNLYRRGQLQCHGSLKALREPRAFHQFLRTLYQQEWVVYAKKPFGGPEHVLQYLSRYTHRVAISNHRLLGMEDGRVTFRWKDYAHGSRKRKMTLTAQEFIRRFLLHVLPRGFVRIRHFGWMANRSRARSAAACRLLLEAERGQPTAPPLSPLLSPERRCPHCGCSVVIVERLTARQLRRMRPALNVVSNSG